jgi:transaldolase
VARRVDADVDEAERVWAALPAVGIDLDDVADRLETEGLASFQASFDELLAALATKADELR